MEFVHVYNGDALAMSLQDAPWAKDTIVMREALIDGPVNAIVNESFWSTRAKFIAQNYQSEHISYREQVRLEISRIAQVNEPLCLWFENDLFCQVNYWFLLHLLFQQKRTHEVFRVYPPGAAPWRTFARITPSEAIRQFECRVRLSSADIEKGAALWSAFAHGDNKALQEYSSVASPAFEYLHELLKVWIASGTRAGIKARVHELGKSTKDFHELFSSFQRQFPMLGYGDLQVQNMLDSK